MFSLWNLFRPNLASMARAGVVADGAVGIVNGVIGGRPGSPASPRSSGEPARLAAGRAARRIPARRGRGVRDDRAVVGGTGMIGGDTLVLFLIGLPALAVGTWAGLKLFGKLDDQAFRRVVLVLLLISGAEPADPRP